MNIFEKPVDKYKKVLRLLLPLFLLILICAAFSISLMRISTETAQNEKLTLEQALQHGAANTYALTGRYPEDLSSLLENYQISYDPERYIVEYIPNGENLFPFISVLPYHGKKGGPS